MVDLVFGRILPWLLVGLGAALIYGLGFNLLRQLGKILIRLEAIESKLGAPAAAGRPSARLPVGAAAPDFELPDLEGRRRSLAEFRGRRVLLIFSSPTCGYCQKMMPDLAAIPPDGRDGWPIPLVVTTGDAEANRRLVQEHGVTCPVLLQERMEVASDKYDIYGTPMGFLIDERGAIASEVAAGAQALLALALAAREDATAAQAEGTGRGREDEREGAHEGDGEEVGGTKGKANKGLAASRLNRDGLAAGTPAPGFRLPRLDGAGDVSLDEYRGRRVLLVFSDPECGPCDHLAPHLERLHRERPDLSVLMIGRRDPELNRRKVERLGLSFPVALQRSWEVSLLYGMFATPIAYLIDEEGVLVADVAKGVEPILELISRAAVPGEGRAGVASRNGEEAVLRS